MKTLFSIFAATTGFTRPLAWVVMIMFTLFLAGFGGWLWADYREVRLRTEVLSQMAVCDLAEQSAAKAPDDAHLRDRLFAEREKLARAMCDHESFLRANVTGVFVSGRQPVRKLD